MDSSSYPTYKKGQLIIHCQSDHKLPKGFRSHKIAQKSVRMSKDLTHVKLIPPREKKTSRSPTRNKKKTKRSPKKKPASSPSTVAIEPQKK